jgi:hypothetical protein
MSRCARPLRLAAALPIAILLLALSATSVLAIDPILDVQVTTWHANSSRGYVGVQTAGAWAPPGTRSCVRYYSTWDHVARIDTRPVRDEWFVKVHTCSGSTVNPLSPTIVITSRTRPGIGIRRETTGRLRLDLGVTVDPVTAPAGTVRTVTAALSGDWLDAIGDEISAYVIRDSVRVRRWTVDFGDGTVRTIAPDPAAPGRLSVTHPYGAGQFQVTVTARVTGTAYGAFFTPAGIPFEDSVPFAIDLTNAATGITGLPVEYVPPVVTVGGSPSGSLPDGTSVTADATGHAAIWWPRGLPCDLFVRPIIEREGFMRSGGVVVGGGETRLVGYRYTAGANDASDASASGTYPAAAPIRIQWNTPLPGTSSYPVRLVLNLETVYDDGTVRTSRVAGTVDVTVVYSAVSQ